MAQDRSVPAPRRSRWVISLTTGVIAGLLLGFAAGLARPRPRAGR